MRVIVLVSLAFALALALVASSTPLSGGSDDVSASQDGSPGTYFTSGGEIEADFDEVDSSTSTSGSPSRAVCRRRRSVTSTVGDPPSDVKDAAPLVRRGRARSVTGHPLSAANSIARHTSLRLRTATRNTFGRGKADGPTTGLFGSAIGKASGAHNILHSGAGGLVRAALDGSSSPLAKFSTEDGSIPAYV